MRVHALAITQGGLIIFVHKEHKWRGLQEAKLQMQCVLYQ